MLPFQATKSDDTVISAQIFREKAASGRNWMMPIRAVWVDMVVLPSENKYRGGRCVWILVWTWLFFCGLDQVHKNMHDRPLKSMLFLKRCAFLSWDWAQHVLVAFVFLLIKLGERWSLTMFVSKITSLNLTFLEWQYNCEKDIVLQQLKDCL